jgi:hypothetical protein
LGPTFGFTTASPVVDAENVGHGAEGLSDVEGSQPAVSADHAAGGDGMEVFTGSPTPHVPSIQRRTARVLIEDCRPTFGGLPPTRAVEVMELGVVESVGARPPGEWCARTSELILRLQESCAAIEGAVKLSYPDPTDPHYHQYFAKVVEGEALVDVKTSLSTLVIPATGEVRVFVETVDTAVHLTLRRVYQPFTGHRWPTAPCYL